MSEKAIVQFADLKFPTSDGRIHLASVEAVGDGQPLVPEPYADARHDNDRLRLLSPASHWSVNNSFGNDLKIEVQLGNASVTINPKEAKARSLVVS